MNNRRKLVIALGAGALTAPLSSFAQRQGKIWRIGFCYSGSRQSASETGRYDAFMQGMRELGYAEGKDIVIEARFADGKFERLPDLAAELVKMNLDVIVTGGTPATQAVQKATKTIPIVFGSAGDPVDGGLIKNLAHPGGNITGLSAIIVDLAPKHLEMLRAMVPKLARVAILTNPSNINGATALRNVQAAALRSGVKVLPVEARTPQEIEKTFSVVARERAGAIIVVADQLFTQQQHQIAELARKHRLPSIAHIRPIAEAGVLMSYGPNYNDMYRRAAAFVDKILKGAKPADLPVEQPTKFELFINGKTAKTLGLEIPQSLLISTDKVLE
jgi:putative ABC transport system substrate-binding protein